MRSLQVTLLFAVIPLLLLSCDQTPSNQAVTDAGETDVAVDREVPPSLSEGKGRASKDFVTTNPKKLAEALRQIGNENEVIVVLKSEEAARVAPGALPEIASGSVVAGVPKTKDNVARRHEPGFAPSGEDAYHGLLTSLDARGVEPYRAHPEAEVMSLRIPDDKLVSVLATLLNHPSVDYIEANQRRRVSFDQGQSPRIENDHLSFAAAAGPNGTNDPDGKHGYHNVLDAWNYTRGDGVQVGILDTGFATDRDAGQGHEDGLPIKMKGFVDDYNIIDACNYYGYQDYGVCAPWDDNHRDYPKDSKAHGTRMAGLVGAADNDVGGVGIMPDGETVSMKIAQDCNVTGGCSNGAWHAESDDFEAALFWARTFQDIDVLSMSFSGTGWGASVRDALQKAYHQDDILLFSSTGNPDDPDSWDAPQEYDVVVGVGGIKDDASYGKDQYEMLAALSRGKTTDASCPAGGTDFCKPDGYKYSGGTSTSTAVVAGIAGLVRAHQPSLSAPQVRERLLATAEEIGYINKVDALAAVKNQVPLKVGFSPPYAILSGDPPGTYSWTATISGEDGSVSYTWEVRNDYPSASWYQAGTGKTFDKYIDSATPNFDLRVTATSAGETDSYSQQIEVNL